MSASEVEYDVVIVGGGPAGCSAGVFTARYGLDTVIFDRGNSSIKRCAYLENYLGFPAGIDIETLYGLMHDQTKKAGCEVVSDFVESVERTGEDDGYVVRLQEGDCVVTRRLIAATRYDGEYIRGLDDDGAMFETYERDGEEHEHFDSGYTNHDGTTPVDGLYVASPSEEANRQAIMAAGRGARVGLRVVEDVRRERGYPETLVDHYDWVRREAELNGEWSDRDRWRKLLDAQFPDDDGIDEEQRVALCERHIDRRFDTYLTSGDTARCKENGQKALLEHIDDRLILDTARKIESERRSTERNR